MIQRLSLAALLIAAMPIAARSDEPATTPDPSELSAYEVVAARVARLQSPLAGELAVRPIEEAGDVQTTPEMWLYMQEMQRYDNPRQAVRRKAQERARQRNARLESRKWFGYSSMRPQASPTPFYDIYSPSWRGNGAHPYEWVGGGLPRTRVRVSAVPHVRY